MPAAKEPFLLQILGVVQQYLGCAFHPKETKDISRNDHEKALTTQAKKDKMTLIDLFRQLLIHQQLAKMSFHQYTILYQQNF